MKGLFVFVIISLIELQTTFGMPLNTSLLQPQPEGSLKAKQASPEDTVGYIGKILPGESKTWTDDTTGCEITQWTVNGENHHPYFTVESFIDKERAIIFSKRTGRDQLYSLNLNNGQMTQMTLVSDLRAIDHLPKFKTIWFLDGKVLKSVRTDNFETKTIYDFSRYPSRINSVSVSCDVKWYIFSVNKKVQTKEDLGYGPYAIYRLNLKDTTLKQITMDYGFNIGHIQANPVDPNLILYCWQWEKFDRPLLVGHAPIRTWWVNIGGTDGGPVTQEYGTQRTHEVWTLDGKAITFVSKYRIGPKNGTHFLGIQSIDGKINERYYSQVSPAHQNLFGDNKHWIVDLYNNQEPLLALITRGKGKIENVKILFRHNSSLEGQSSHPHPRFSLDGKYVLFSTDKTGTAQVYTVKTGIDKNR